MNGPGKLSLPSFMRLKYAAHGLAGCVQRRRARSTGHLVGVYQSEQSGIEIDPATPWSTVCEEHASVVCHSTLAGARAWAAEPQMWCEQCQEEMDAYAATHVRNGVRTP